MSTINTNEHYRYLLNKNQLRAFKAFLAETMPFSCKNEMVFNLGYSYRYLQEITKADRVGLREPDPTNINTTQQDIASFLKNRMEKEAAKKVLKYLYKQSDAITSPMEFYKYVELYTANLELKVDKYETERLLENGITAYNLRHYTEDFEYLIKYYIEDNKKADRIIEILNARPKYRYKLMQEWREEDRKEKREKEMKEYRELYNVKD